MKEELSDEQNEAILKALDEAIKNGPWDKSNFLGAISKELTDMREHFASQLGARSQAQQKADSYTANRVAHRAQLQEVYISLYSTDGANMQSWERIVSNLPRQMVSRPIYENEEHVQLLIKSKEHKINEAYVAIFINQAGIIPLTPDKALADKFGNPLLTLKDNTLNVENIGRFVHASGIYQFENGHLVKT